MPHPTMHPGEVEGASCLCSIPEIAGPSWWAILHGTAEAIRDKGCVHCGGVLVQFMRGLHDVVNAKLGKPIMYPTDLKFLQAAVGKAVAAAGAKMPKMKVADTAVYDAVKRLQFNGTEKVYVLYLDKPGGKIVAQDHVATGGKRSALVPIDQIMHDGWAKGATAAYLVHNHPSGNPQPSEQDVQVTQEAQKAAAQHGFTLVDHLIVAGDNITSLLGNGGRP